MTCRIVSRPAGADTKRWERIAQRVLKASLARKALEIDREGQAAEAIRSALRTQLEGRGFRVHVRVKRRSVIAWADQPGTAGRHRVSRVRG